MHRQKSNGYYITDQNIYDSNSGVSKKIKNQILIFEEHGTKIELFQIERLNFVEKIIRQICRVFIFLPNYSTLKLLKQLKATNTKSPNFIYIRFFLFDKKFINYLIALKRKNSQLKILLEIPTYPYSNEGTSYLRKKAMIRVINTYFMWEKCFDKIVTFSADDEIYGIPTIKIANGVNYGMLPPKKITNCSEINVIAVGLFDEWHGYDRFINGLNDYYLTSKSRKVKLHLVGDGPALVKYKILVSKHGIQEYVKFYGFLCDASLDLVYDRSELALDALARHRSNVYYNSSLKGKEYCAKGFPIISGVKTELDNFNNYRYYMRVNPDETSIDIESIVKFYDSIYQNTDKNCIVREIRSYTEKKFDIKYSMLPVIRYISGELL